MHGRKLIVLDFDNTLFFADAANRKAAKELFKKELTRGQIRKLPNAQKGDILALANSKYAHMLKPNSPLIRKIRRLALSHKVIILSARKIRKGDQTASLLERAGVKYDERHHRRNILIPDEEWKLRKIKALAKGYGQIEIYDDKRENLKYISKYIEKGGAHFYHVEGESISRYK